MLRTKIVCTIGPASRDPEILEDMVRAGMDVARLNFSHGTHALHAENVERIRAAAMNVGRPVAILADLQGPKLRVGNMSDGVILEAGSIVTITTDDVVGTEELIPLQFQELTQAIEPGDRILLDDGLLELRVTAVREETAEAEVIIGGILKSKKGFNLPRTPPTISAITDKDRADLQFALEEQVDWIALSFVRTADEVLELKELIRGSSAFGRPVPVIAKIEKPEAVKNLDDIIEVSDGIMVARGDLAIETSTEEVPMIQKTIIQKCNVVGKPVITATQMLDSMIHNPRPTRAEASDVANAILDGTDAVMLSGETAAGDYPLRSVQMMAKIAVRAEQTLFSLGLRSYNESEEPMNVAAAVARATVETARDLKAAAIITPTMSGSTARLLSKYRPSQLIIATTPSPMVQRQLCVHWGIVPLLAKRTENTDEMIDASIEAALEEELVHEDDCIVLTAGTAGSPPGSTDLMKVHVIRRRIGTGTGIGNQIISGRVRKLESPVDPKIEIESDEIIVTTKTDRSFIDIAQRAAGLVAEQEGLSSHSAILAVELGLAAIVGVAGITGQVEDGQTITLDTRQGTVFEGRAV